MLKIDNISVKAAKEYLNCHIINSRIESLILNNASPVQSKPSIFYFQETLKMDNHDEFDKITLNVAFRTVGNKEPTTIIFSPESVFEQGSIKSKLFGEKSFTWISKVLSVLDSMTFKSKFAARDNVEQSRKLKVLSIMMNIVTRTLYEVFPDQVKALVNYIRDRTNSEEDLAISRLNRTFSGASLAESSSSFDPDTQKLLEKSRLFQPQTMALVTQLVTGTPDSQILALGLPLLLSLWQVFECQVRQTVGNDLLSKSLIEEQSIVIFSITTLKYSSFENFLLLTSKRLQVTLFLLCDAINFDDSKLNQQTMDKIKNIGLQLERLHSGSHDISKFRLERGIKRLIDGQNQSSQGIEYQFTNTNNTFLAWLQYQKHMNADTVIELHDNPNYVSTWKALVQEFWNQLPHSTGRNRIEFIAEDVLEKATAIYVDYYELNWY